MAAPRRDRRRDPRHRAAVDVALALAELNAAWAEYERALEHLRAADELCGGTLRGRFARQYEAWSAGARRAASAR